MADPHHLQKLSDADVRRILLAPRGSDWPALAASLGCSESIIKHYRRRGSKRALRIAMELGLIPRFPQRAPRIAEDNERAAYVIQGARGE